MRIFVVLDATMVMLDHIFIILCIEVYSQLGQLILSDPHKNEIDISFLNSGMYFVKIANEKGDSTVKKLIKN